MPESSLRRLPLPGLVLFLVATGCQAASSSAPERAGEPASGVPEPGPIRIAAAVPLDDGDGLAATEDCDAVAKRMSVSALDQMWGGVLEDTESYLANCPRGSQMERATFYHARAQDRLRRFDQAISSYQAFLAKYCAQGGDGSFLCEDATVSLYQVAGDRVSKGETEKLQILLDGLRSGDFSSKVFAGIQISKLPENQQAKAKALPLLIEANRLEDDPDLRNEICLAILRIDPSKCSGATRSGDLPEPQMIKVRVFDCRAQKERVKVNLPFAFAEAAIESLGPDVLGAIEQEGFDLENLWTAVKKLKPAERLTFSVDDDDECLNVEIWFE